MKDFLIKFLSSGFGVAFLIPWGPGIWGIFLGIILSLLVNQWFIVWKLVLFFVITIIGIPLSTKAEKLIAKGKDSHHIVIDEIGGIFFASLWFNLWQPIYLFNLVIPLFLLLTILFIIFDSVKPFPIKKIEALFGGWGIVLDDLAAAIYALLIVKFLIL